MKIEAKKSAQKKVLRDKALEDKSCFYYQVAPSIKAPVFKSFLYKSHWNLKPGQRVKIPFGPRQIIGFILNKIEDSSAVPPLKIKNILAVDASQPPISPEKLDWLKWMSAYYHYPLGSILSLSFLSPSFKKRKPKEKTQNKVHLKSESSNPINSNLEKSNQSDQGLKNSNQAKTSKLKKLNSIKLKSAIQNPTNSNQLENLNLETLGSIKSNPEKKHSINSKFSNQHLTNTNQAKTSKLKKLNPIKPITQKLALPHESENPSRRAVHLKNSPVKSAVFRDKKELSFSEDRFLKLTPEQEKCAREIPIDNSFQVHLIHGITGSGKTEVYIRLIAEALKKGGQALVLLPEIFLTPQIVKKLSHVFPDQIALWHSQITKAQKKKEAQALLEGAKNLLVGTRSALFCPLPKLALILIDEEHDSSFKQEDSLRYQARDSALVLAQKKKVPVVLGSATPDFSSYQKALDSSYKLHELKTRALQQKLPQVTVVDLKAERKKSPFFWLSDFLLERMEKTLKEGKQTALFLNRRGQAKALLCAACGHVLKCSNCDISLTLHQKDYLICHYCSHLEPKPHRCEKCQSDHWLERGLGTQKVEEEIKKLFPQYKTLRADRDSITSQKELLNFIEKVEKEEIQILIGTQMLAKGLNFPSLRLVGLLLADMDFNFPDFRAEERGFQTLLQMAGRAGRADLGEVILQSFCPEHPNFQFLKSHDYKSFFSKSIQSRKAWAYPPFSKLCLLKIDSLKEKEGQAFAKELTKNIRSLSADLLDPGSKPVSPAKLNSKNKRPEESINSNPIKQNLSSQNPPAPIVSSQNLSSQKLFSQDQPRQNQSSQKQTSQNQAPQDQPLQRGQKNSPLIQILGPSAAPLMKIKNRYRFQILIKAKNHELMSRLLQKLTEKTPKKSFIQLKIDRDPHSML